MVVQEALAVMFNEPDPMVPAEEVQCEKKDSKALEVIGWFSVGMAVAALGICIGADHPATRYSGIGGNVPQSLVNRACMDIQQGHADIVLVAGAEMWRTRTQLRAAGQRLAYTEQDESVPIAQGSDENVPMA